MLTQDEFYSRLARCPKMLYDALVLRGMSHEDAQNYQRDLARNMIREYHTQKLARRFA